MAHDPEADHEGGHCSKLNHPHYRLGKRVPYHTGCGNDVGLVDDHNVSGLEILWMLGGPFDANGIRAAVGENSHEVAAVAASSALLKPIIDWM